MAAKLSPIFNDQTFDQSNILASGYKLFAYVAGSTTKLTTYNDSAGSVPHPNPIILNALGYPTTGPIWLSSGQSYKFVLALPTDTDPPSAPVKTIDNVTGINDASISVSQWSASGLTPTYISASSFSLAGDQTSEFHVGRRVQATTSGGTVYGTILTSVFAALTTVSLTMDSPGVLDAGLSVVNLSLLRNDHLAIPYEAMLRTGTATNDSAPTGDIGEYLEAVVVSGSAVTISSGATGNIATLALSAGDWDVDATFGFNTAPTTTVSYWGGGASVASATLPAFQHVVRDVLSGAAVNTPTYGVPLLNAPTQRISLATGTTLYLVGSVGYGVSTLTCFGALRARRVR